MLPCESLHPSRPGLLHGEVTLTGAGSASTQNGSTYWTQPVELEVSYNGGAPAPYHAEVEMVDQGGTWAFLATSTPKPGP